MWFFAIGLTRNSTYVDIESMARTPNSSPQTRELLVVMSGKPRAWQHGYQLSKDTGLASGTLYPLLIRLSDQGLLESQWQEPECPGKPARHVYRLTPNGLAFVHAMRLSAKSAVFRPAVVGVISGSHKMSATE
jgi:PadR family transcriptional regulator PadR